MTEGGFGMGIEEALRRMAGDAGRETCREAAEALGVGTAGCADAGEDECEECAARIAAAVVARMVPEGVEWPRDADGEPIDPTAEYECEGEDVRIWSMHYFETGVVNELDVEFVRDANLDVRPTWKLRRKRPDTQELIDEDAYKQPCGYFGWAGVECDGDGGCPAFGKGNCRTAMTRDLLRRQRELCERENGGGR